MKVLITSDFYLYAINGVTTSVYNLKRELEREGHEVMIVTLSESRKSYMEDNVIHIGSVSAKKIYSSARIKFAPCRKWIDTIIAWKPDVVHSQCEFSTFSIAKTVAKKLDIPLIHTYHTVYEDYTHYFCPNKKLGKKLVIWFTRRICKKVDCVIAPTEKISALLKDYKIKSDIAVVPSGLQLDKFGGNNHGNTPSRQPVLLFLGRLAREKNVGEIINYLKDYNGEVTFVIAGGGPCEEELKKQAETMPANVTVRFTGMIPPENVPEYYSSADLFVCASQSETQGLTYIEAAASGLPLLCRKDDCLNSVIMQGKNGWTFENEGVFLSRLDEFLKMDGGAKRKMGKNSKQIAKQFDVTNTVPQIVNIYKKAVYAKTEKQTSESKYAKLYIREHN
ncbi:MAG: glycosyltransferase family 4 protein [Clostridia bacterium]|nr:glycosyltransferase family 4 protein [Clostridia bacterium]